METACEEGHVPISPTTQTHCLVEGSIYQKPAVRPAGHTVRRKDNKQILSATALPKRRSVPASSTGRRESTAPSTAMSPSLPPAPPDDGTVRGPSPLHEQHHQLHHQNQCRLSVPITTTTTITVPTGHQPRPWLPGKEWLKGNLPAVKP